MKYKLTEEIKEYGSLKLYRIEAIESFSNVSKGDKGGFVEKEENLSQDGDAWVYGKIKCETGYYFARKNKEWKIEEIKVDDENVVLWRE